MPAALLQLLPLLIGLIASHKTGPALKSLAGTKALSKFPRLAGALGGGGLLPSALSLGSFIGGERLASSVFGLDQVDQVSTNEGNFSQMLNQGFPAQTENEIAFEDLQRALSQGVF